MSSRMDSLETLYAKLSAENKLLANKLQITCDELSNESRELKQNTNNLDNYSRRSKGLTEPQGESNAEREKAARNFFIDQLKLPDDIVSWMKFEGCHRLGK